MKKSTQSTLKQIMPVKILPPEVVAKIAAGEVVERPASVIKELVENSIDANSSSIEIHLKDAGKELIHIKDDGCGISKDDMEQLFNRHATSKLKSIDDLQELMSMGFRGEALYSIAAVSDILLRSKTKKSDAWEIHLQASERLSLKPTALSSHGTEIKITQLFFNTPARRKFLKTTTAEMQSIMNVFQPYCLLYPLKRFLLTHAGKTLIDLSPSANAIDRMSQALNINASDLMEASEQFDEIGVKVRMILSNINVQRPRRDLQFIFVNNRPVENRNLSFNMNDVFRLILPPGLYPAFILDIQIDPSEVDVNIHPTKKEVRLRGESRLISFIRHMCEYTLMQKGSAKTVTDEPINDSSLIQKAQSFMSKYDPSANQYFLDTSANANVDTPGSSFTSHINRTFSTSHWQTNQTVDLFNKDNNLKEKFANARYVGQFINKFLLFETGNCLLIVDQHAAQERIMFEKFKDQIENRNIEVQPLLVPLTIGLTPTERIAWEEMNLKMSAIGIETSLFDDDTLAIQTHPLLLKSIDQVVRSLLGGDDVARCDHLTIAKRACKASIVSGDKLESTQAEFQRKQLLACKDPFTCPHGRPTVIELSESFLDKQFLRT